MKRLSLISCLIVSFGVAALAAAAAGKSGGGMTLTGCLQKGDEPNTYLLTNATGPGSATKVDRWELIGAPASLKLNDHVGHKIEVRGNAVGSGAAAKIEGKTTNAAKAEEAGEHHLKVRSMKHIAPTCP